MEFFEESLILVFIEVMIIDVMFFYNMIIVKYGLILEWDWLLMIMDFVVVEYINLVMVKGGLLVYIEISK